MWKRKVMGWLSVALFALTARAAAGQSVADAPRTRDGKPLPMIPVRDQSSGTLWPVWVAYEGYEARERPGHKERPVRGATTRFMQKCFFVLKEQPLNEGEYYLVGAEEDLEIREGKEPRFKKLLGWIPREFLVSDPTALKRERTALDGTKSVLQGFHRKGIIVNTVELIGMERTYSEAVAVRRAPTDSANVTGHLRLFSFFFIFGECGAATKEPSDDYVLLGTRAYFGDDGTQTPARLLPTSVVLGWIPKSRLREWNTREALYWDHESAQSMRRTPGRIWKTPVDAYLARPDIWSDTFPDLKLVGTPRSIPTEENFVDGHGVPPEHDQMRHAILDWPDPLHAQSLDPDTRRAFPQMAANISNAGLANKFGDWRLLRLGALGDFVLPNGQSVAQSKVRQFQNDIARISRQLELTEVLFIVDDTSSMKGWFNQHTARAIREIVSAAKESAGDKAQLRVAAAYYNDLDVPLSRSPEFDEGPGFAVGRLADATRKEEIERLLKAVESRADRGGGGDSLEMLLHGIDVALTKTDFDPDSTKLIVVIGDQGDNGLSSNKGPGPTVAQVAARFKTRCRDGALLVVHVANDAQQINRDEDMKKFRDDMKSLVDDLNKGYDKPLSRYESASNVNGLLVQVKALYARLREEMRVKQAGLEDARKGGKPPASVVRNLRAEYKDDPEMLLLLDSLEKQTGVQLYFEGYAWYYDGDDQAERRKCDLRPYVLADISDVDRILGLLESIKPGKSGTIAGAQEGIEGTQAGEYSVVLRDFERETLRSIDQSGLEFRSKVFHNPTVDARQAKSSVRQQELRRLEHCRQRLIDAKRNERRDYRLVKETLNGSVLENWFPTKAAPVFVQRTWVVPGLDARQNGDDDGGFYWIWLDRLTEWP